MKIIKYFLEFISILSLFAIFKILGLRNASNLGSVLGRFIGPLFRAKKIIRENIKIALGEINEQKEYEIINGMWSNIGRTFAEYVFLKDFKFNKTKFDHMKINGINHLDKIKKNNEAVIFYSAHFANFELMAMELDKFGIKCAAIYRPLNNIFLNPIMEYIRKKHICKIQIKKGISGTKDILKNFNKGSSIALMIDQRVTQGIKCDFFKKKAFTTTIPAQFVKKYGVKVVPIYIERIKGNSFKLKINDAIKFGKEDTTESITLKLNKILETMIRKKPEEWIWTHNRWKA